jgi:hypothetical protein
VPLWCCAAFGIEAPRLPNLPALDLERVGKRGLGKVKEAPLAFLVAADGSFWLHQPRTLVSIRYQE